MKQGWMRCVVLVLAGLCLAAGAAPLGAQACPDGSCPFGAEECDFDGNPCTLDCVIFGTCAPTGGFCENPCEDGDACTGGTQSCNPDDGACEGGTELCCNDGVDNDEDGLMDCEDPDCVGQPCDDGASCTSGDTCSNSLECVGTPDDGVCSNQLFCDGEEVCDPADPNANALGCTMGAAPCPDPGALCDDADDTCTEQACDDGEDNDADGMTDCLDPDCQGQPCSDGFDCTVNDACDAASGTCRGDADDSVCSNQLFCDGMERCDPDGEDPNALGCVAGSEPCPRDGEECDEASQSCREVECGDGVDNDQDGFRDCRDDDCEGLACDDGVECTTGDMCGGGRCTGTSDNSLCDDGFACTEDLCQGVFGCLNTPMDAACDDGLFCNGEEVCSPGADSADEEGCLDLPAPCNEATAACDEDTDSCGETACRDDIDNDLDGAIDCLDEDCACGDGSFCDEAIGKCRETDCGDGLDNDGDQLIDCADPDCSDDPCDDGFACTGMDRCRDGTCRGTPDDGACSNQLFCDGAEICNPDSQDANALGCTPGPAPCPSGTLCVETTDRCREDACGDGLDNDGDDLVDCEDPDCLLDEDGDGFARAPCGEDCDDGNDDIFPDRFEDCSTPEDDNCDGVVNCDDPTCFPDRDGDGEASVPCGTDCDDRDPNNYAGNEETCFDRRDNDCDQQVDCTDVDCDTRGCDDGLRCTVEESCVSGSCVGTPVDRFCDDGFFCNGVEFCDPEGPGVDNEGCVAGEEPCQAGEICDEEANECRDDACEPDEFEPDDDCVDSRPIVARDTLQSEVHTFCPEGDVDRFGLEVEEGRQYAFFATGELDTFGTLLRQDCSTVLASNDDCGGVDRNFCITWTATFSGIVLLKVEASPKSPDRILPDGGVVPGVETGGEPADWEGWRGLRTPAPTAEAPGRPGERLGRGRGPSTASLDTGSYTFWYFVTEPACQVDEFEEDGQCTRANLIDPSPEAQVRSHTLCPGQDLDFFAFEATEGKVYAFRSEGTTDTAAAITDDLCGRFLLKDENCGAGNENFCFEWRAPRTGLFKLGVTGSLPGPYDLAFQERDEFSESCEPDAAEDGDDLCGAGTVLTITGEEQSLARTLCPAGDFDHFTFQAEAGARYRFRTTGATDTLGNIRDASCNKLVGNDDCDLPDDLNFCLEVTAPASGTFHLRVRGFNLDQTEGDYRLRYQRLP